MRALPLSAGRRARWGGDAALILVFAGALPFLIVGVPLVWMIQRWRQRARARRVAAQRAAEPPAAS